MNRAFFLKIGTCIYCILFIGTISISCKKNYNNVQPNSLFGLKVIAPNVIKVNATPQLVGDIESNSLSSSNIFTKLSNSDNFNFDGPLLMDNAIGKKIGLVEIRNDYFWNDKDPGRTFEGVSDEQVILPETALDIIYPGSILKGNSVNDQSSIIPVRPDSYTPKPIEVSATISTRKVFGRINPDKASFEEFKQQTLNQVVPSEQNISFQVDIKTFMDYSELKYMFGSNAKTNALFFSNTSTSTNNIHKVSKKTGVVIKYTQENFSIDISTPEVGELYENLDSSGLMEVSPVYVSSITYGRMGILVAESDSDSEDVIKAFQSAFNAFGLVNGSKSITEAERNIINGAKMKVCLAGVKGKDAIRVIEGFDEFLKLINNTRFSKNAPGVPISFKMRYLINNQIVKTHFQIDIGFPLNEISFVPFPFEFIGKERVLRLISSWREKKKKNPISKSIVITLPQNIEIYMDVDMTIIERKQDGRPNPLYREINYIGVISNPNHERFPVIDKYPWEKNEVLIGIHRNLIEINGKLVYKVNQD